MNLKEKQGIAGNSIKELLQNLLGDPDRYLDSLEGRFVDLEPRIQAYLPEPARLDRLRSQFASLIELYSDVDHRPPLFGLPVGVKDIFHADGYETHAGSQLPAEVLTGGQATSVSQLKAAGALVLGKTVSTEFAYFAPGPTRNPHNLSHTPGGSSSGSAAAVAAGLAPFALGTQTVGSINRPAAFCGVVGFKPSYGRISTEGVIPLSPSLDHVGFFTTDVSGARTVAPILVADWRSEETSLRTLGIPTGPYLEAATEAALENFDTVRAQLESHGLTVKEVPAMPDYAQIAERHNLILAAEAAKVHGTWFDEYGDRYHPKTAELVRRGQGISQEDLEEALEGRQALRSELESLMADHAIDLWISPAARGPAPEGLESTGDPAMNLPWTHSGLPTVSIPSGQNSEGLPMGTQLTGYWNGDELLLASAQIVEGVLAAG